MHSVSLLCDLISVRHGIIFYFSYISVIVDYSADNGRPQYREVSSIIIIYSFVAVAL